MSSRERVHPAIKGGADVSAARSSRRSGVVLGVTDAITARAFLKPHIRMLQDCGADVTLVASAGENLDSLGATENVRVIGISSLRRLPAPFKDLRALVEGTRLLRTLRPVSIHVGTPKAGLILGLAGWVCRVPIRVYTMHGLRYQTMTGCRATFMRILERVACWAATTVIAVSPSVASAAVTDGVVGRSKVRVLGRGSISGVDLARFSEDPLGRSAARAAWGLTDTDRVVLFVGRLSIDKGIRELAEAWALVSEKHASCHLMVVGALDDAQPVPGELLELLTARPNVTFTGKLGDPVPAYRAADLLVLPSHREGFGTVTLEAASLGIPCVSTNVTGCRDAVVDGITGLLTPLHDPEKLAEALLRLLEQDDERRRMGAAARVRVTKDFNQDVVVRRYITELAW